MVPDTLERVSEMLDTPPSLGYAPTYTTVSVYWFYRVIRHSNHLVDLKCEVYMQTGKSNRTNESVRR